MAKGAYYSADGSADEDEVELDYVPVEAAGRFFASFWNLFCNPGADTEDDEPPSRRKLGKKNPSLSGESEDDE